MIFINKQNKNTSVLYCKEFMIKVHSVDHIF